jgi:hypothetical protein
LQLTEIETTVLDKPNEPCTVYSAEREESVKRFSQCCKNAIQVSISPTFYEQLLCQNPFAKKITNPNCKHMITAQKKLSYEKAVCKILVKLTPGNFKIILELLYSANGIIKFIFGKLSG